MVSIWAASKHYLIHLGIAIFLYAALTLLGKEISLTVWFLGTFLMDIDHIISLLNPNDPTTKKILEVFNSDKELQERLNAGIKVLEKEGFTKLILHNIPALALVFTVVIFHFQNLFLFSLFGAFLVHQLFDLSWDIKRWGNINHWLWKENEVSETTSPLDS